MKESKMTTLNNWGQKEKKNIWKNKVKQKQLIKTKSVIVAYN